MRVWLYGRLSNDDDAQMNSLENQMEILRAYAAENRFQVVGESWDDNVSGMRFDRKGVEQASQAAEAGKLDAVILQLVQKILVAIHIVVELFHCLVNIT